MYGCKKGCIKPTTDDSSIECDGDFKLSDCILISKDYPYFGIKEGDTLTVAIDKITNNAYWKDQKISSLEQRVAILENQIIQ